MRSVLLPVFATLFVFASAPGAHAANVYRGDSWVNFINAAGKDTSLVPGGDTTLVGNQVAAFGIDTPNITANPNDTALLTSITIRCTSAGSFPGDSIISAVRLYADPGNGQLYASNFTLLGTLTSATQKGPDTATYGFSPSRTFTSRETYVIMLESVNDSYVNGRTIQAQILVNQASIFDTANIGINRPSAQIDFPIFVFKRDSPVIQVFRDGDSVIHPDTRQGENPFKVLTGSIQGETRTSGGDGDTVTRFGVALSGTGADSVDSVWLVLGPTESYALLSQSGLLNGDSLWVNLAVNKTITGSGQLETFVVYARYTNNGLNGQQLGYPFLGETIFAYIPKDSIQTRFRYNMGDNGDSAHSERNDSSGLRIINRDTVFIAISNVAVRNVSPYRAVADSALVLQGRIGGGGALTYDTLLGFGVRFVDGGKTYTAGAGTRRTTADSVTSVIVNFGRGAGDTTLVRSANDTAVWFLQGETTIDSSLTSGTVSVYVRWLNHYDTFGGDTTSSNVPPGETMAFIILGDSVFTFFAKDSAGTGNNVNYASGGTITFFNGESIQFIDSGTIGNLTINPALGSSDTPVLVGQWIIRGNAQNRLAPDTLTQIGFRFTGSVIAPVSSPNPDSIAEVFVYIDSSGGGGSDSRRISLARSEVGTPFTPVGGISLAKTEWHAAVNNIFPISGNGAGSFVVSLFVAFEETCAAQGETIVATLLNDTTRTVYTPDTNQLETSSRLITIFKPSVFIAMDSLASGRDSVSVFADQHDSGGIRGDSIHVLKGRIGAGALFDTLIEFGVVIKDSTLSVGGGMLGQGSDDSSFSKVILSLVGRGETELRFGWGNFTGNPAKPVGDSVWYLDGDTNIDSGITFNVYVRVRKDSQLIWRGDTMLWGVREDSIATTLSNKFTQTNDTTSAETTEFIVVDTVTIKDTGTLVDVHINPDTRFNNDTILVLSVVVTGEQNKTYLGDTFETISFRLDGSAGAGYTTAGDRDSVSYAYVMLDTGAGDSRIDLRRVGDGWATQYATGLGAQIPPGNTSVVLRFWVNMYDTMYVEGDTLRAAINADSIRTFYTTGTSTVVQSNRIVHFEKDTLQFVMSTVRETTISPFTIQHRKGVDETVVVLSGTIRSGSHDTVLTVNYDTLVAGFAVHILDGDSTTQFSGDSIAEVKLRFIGGSNQSETVLQRAQAVGADVDSWYLLGDTRIDSVQVFVVEVKLGSDSFSFVTPNADSFRFSISLDSARTQFTQSFSDQATGDTNSSGTVAIFYLDTVAIDETGGITDVEVSPDPVVGQNPVLAWRGTVRGQRFRSDLRDSFQRFGFRIEGTALSGIPGAVDADSIQSAWFTIESGPTAGIDTITLSRAGTNDWSATFDSAMPTIDTHGTDSFIVSVYLRGYDTMVGNGETMRIRIFPDSVATFYAAETTQIETASRTIKWQKDTVQIIMDRLNSETVFSFNLHYQDSYPGGVPDSNPVLACSGIIRSWANLGYDTLAGFFIRVDTFNATNRGLRRDSIVQVFAVFAGRQDSWGANFPDTILLSDSISHYAIIQDTVRIKDTQPFKIFVELVSQRVLMDTILGTTGYGAGDTFQVIMPGESPVRTAFTSDSVYNDTHSGSTDSNGNIITFAFNDKLGETTRIGVLVLGDTTVNPDTRIGQNPFILAEGKIFGRRVGDNIIGHYGMVSDSLIYFATVVHSAYAINGLELYSVDTVWLRLGARNESFVMTLFNVDTQGGTPYGHYRVRPDTHLLGWQTGLVNSGTNTDTNTDTFQIVVQVRDSITEDPDYNNPPKLSARVYAESIITQLTSRDSDGDSYVQSRIITFQKKSFAIGMTTLGALDNRSPFRTQIETNTAIAGTSTILTGQFTSTQVPKDSLSVFRIGITGSPRVGPFSAAKADSLLAVRIYIGPGASGTPETTIALAFDTGSVDSSTYKLPYTITIETDQVFHIWITAADTPTTDSKSLMVSESLNDPTRGDTGETLTANIESAVAVYSIGSIGGLSLTSSRMITYFYNDTVSISDSSLGSLTVNPDSRLGQNPVLVLAGLLQGQTTKSGLGDTIQEIGVRFTGTALGVSNNDSVTAVYMYLGLENDSIQFTRVTNNGWRVLLDSGFTPGNGNRDTIAIYARLSETMALTGQTLVASLQADSVHTYYTADTTLTDTSQRTVTIDKNQITITMINLGDSTVSPFRIQRRDNNSKGESILIMGGTIARPVSVTDTIIKFGIRLADTSPTNFAASAIETVTVLFSGTVPLNLVRSGLGDTFWSLETGAIVDNMSANQAFSVYIQLIDSEALANRTGITGFGAIGETFVFRIVTDSVVTVFGESGPAADTHSSRTLTVFYTDTIAVTDSALGAITIHPDTMAVTDTLSQTFLAWQGTVRGQNTISTLNDTLLKVGFEFFGTALGDTNIADRDSIGQAWIWVRANNGETQRFDLRREGASGRRWGVRTDTPFATPATNGGTVTVSLYVRVYDTTAVAQCSDVAKTISVRIPADSFQAYYANEADTVTGSRTVTIGKDVVQVVMPARNLSYPGTIETGVLKEIAYFEILSTLSIDTITRIIVEVRGLTGDTALDTMVLALDSGKKLNVGRDERYDTQYDSQIGFFTKIGSGTGWDTWQFVPEQAYDTRLTTLASAGGSMTLMILVELADTAPGSSAGARDSIQIRIPDCTGIQLRFQARAPTVRLTYDSYLAISPDSNPPLPPTFLTLDVATAGQMKISFDPSPGGDTAMSGGQYNLYFDSGSGVYPDTLFQVFSHISGKTVYDTTVTHLVPDSTYRFRVEAQDLKGNQGSSLLASATFRGAATQLSPLYAAVGITQPQNGGVIYRSQTIQLVANVTTGNYNDITSVRFDSRPAAAGGTFASLGTVAAADAIFDANGKAYYTLITDSSHFPPVGTGAGADSYEIRAVASGNWGTDTYAVSSVLVLTNDPSAAAIVNIADSQGASSVTLDPTSQAEMDTKLLAADIDTTVATDLAVAEYTVSTQTTAKTLTVVTPSQSFSVAVTLGKASLSADTDRIVITAALNGTADTILTACKNIGVGQPRYWVDIDLQSGQRTLDDGDSTLVSLSYNDANNDDIDDSFALHIDRARIYTIGLDGVTIEPVEIVRVDRQRKTVIGRVRHFSPFFLSNDTGVTNAGLNRLLVGPNPYRPHSTDFTAQGLTPGIIFKNLPPAWKIEIYSLLGERVTEFSSSSTNATPTAGHVVWDARSEAGKNVASGYYIYIVTDLGTQQRVTGKLAIIR